MFLHWAFFLKIYNLYSCTFQRINKKKLQNNLVVRKAGIYLHS